MAKGVSLFASGSLNDAKVRRQIHQAGAAVDPGDRHHLQGRQLQIVHDRQDGRPAIFRQHATRNSTSSPPTTTWTSRAATAFENYDFTVGIYNVLNQRNLLSVTINDTNPIGGANVYDVNNRAGSLDQYYYAPATSFQFSVQARF